MRRASKALFKLFTNLLCLFFVSYIITQKSPNPIVKKKLTRYLPDIKYLLLWTELHDISQNGQKRVIEKKCFNFNCYFTTNRTLLGDIQYFDGIIFNVQDMSKGMRDMPSERGYSQKYIFAANDSADNYPVCNSVYENFFNWTWTYKADSTIPYRFFNIYKLNHEKISSDFKWEKISQPLNNSKKEVTTKSKAAAIFLDVCTTRSKREVFVQELSLQLKKYNMTVDVFGKCGTKDCRRRTMKPCLWKLKKFYFFYLALEDSFADDYVTSAVMYAYENNAVPIVYGKADYHRFLPPNSYLDGLQLGAKTLADIINRNMYDPKLYKKFFEWKSRYLVKRSEALDVCTLCTAINNPTWLKYSFSYQHFRKWWNPMFKSRCAKDV